MFCLHASMCTMNLYGAQEAQKRVLGTLGMKIQAKLWAAKWVLGIEPRFSEEQPVILTIDSPIPALS